MRRLWISLTLLLALSGLLPVASAQGGPFGDDELLPADEAFAFSARVVEGDRIQATWKVADGYYLYRSRIQFRSDTPGIRLGEPRFPPGKRKRDEFFGDVEIYQGTVTIEVPFTRGPDAGDSLTLTATSQGCAERGVCYPPHRQTVTLELPPATAATAAPAPAAAEPGPLQALRDLGGKLGLGGASDFLPVDEAFRMAVAAPSANEVVVSWQIAPGYYLYRDKFKFTLVGNDSLQVAGFELPPGEVKQDETFGRVEVYHDGVEARVRFLRTDTAATEFTLVVGYQGCAEAGICYPPQTRQVKLTLPAVASLEGLDSSSPPAAPAAAAPAAPLTEQDRIAARLASGDTLLTLLSFFGFGLLLAFTPCVFPMIPILSSIIVGQGRHITTGRAFSLSLAYVLAMALTYTAAGVIAGLTGENLQAAFQNPWILSAFAAVFVLLALSMFGFYELQMPAALQSRLSELSNRQKGGTLVGAAIMGFLSALIVGPCVAAPLAGALIYISHTGDPVLGGMALFALSLGMGAPLVAIGTGAGKLLPRAGDWMNAVKAVFGVLLLAVAIWMLERILPTTVSLLLWAALLIISSVYLGALERLDLDATGWEKLRKGFGVLVLAYGLIMLVGVAAGARDIYQPLRGTFSVAGAPAGGETAATARFRTVKGLAEVEAAIAEANRQGKTVMLDFYADWCTECHRMEKYTFNDPGVQAALANTVLLQADVTANDDIDKALLKHFGLIGPPSILFFDRNGRELSNHRVMGYMDAETFAAHVKAAFGATGTPAGSR